MLISMFLLDGFGNGTCISLLNTKTLHRKSLVPFSSLKGYSTGRLFEISFKLENMYVNICILFQFKFFILYQNYKEFDCRIFILKII